MVELIDFINQEKINKKVNGKKMFNYFSKCIIKSIIELNNKFKKIENKTNSIISGINMIYNIFFILIFYSNNIKLTIFLVERAVMLYSEFIIMSKDKKIIDDICFIPNINDAVSFSYKKTIGPLNINKLNIKQDQECIKDMALVLKQIIIYYYIEYKDTFETKLEEMPITKLEQQIYELFIKYDINTHIELINYFNNILNEQHIDKIIPTIKNIINSGNISIIQ
tara:strand:- start:549 stop:1220 length:672 start_codon:yes stop_codon:yes gene_type:complete